MSSREGLHVFCHSFSREMTMKQNCGTVTLMAVGDVMLGGKIGMTMLNDGWEYPFRYVASTFKEADIVFGNLPTPLSHHNERNPAKPESHLLKADPRAIQGLKYARFNVLSLANNHALDFGSEALFETTELLANDGINYVGAGINESEARKPIVVHHNGVDVAFLAYSCSYPATRNGPGCAPIRLSIIEEDVIKARALADVVVVSLHQGLEYSDYPVPAHISLTHKIIESGADLILGHHPHVLQGIEHYDRGVIVHSLGNFVHDTIHGKMKEEAIQNCALSKMGNIAFAPDDRRPSESIIFKCILGKNGITDIDIIPIRINKSYQPEILNGEAGELLLSRLELLSSELDDRDMPIWDMLTEVNAKENVTSLFKRDPLYIFKKLHRIRGRHLRLLMEYLSSILSMRKGHEEKGQ